MTNSTTLSRSDVVHAARRLIEEQGSNAISIETVARALALDEAAVLWHVKDRVELVIEVIDDAVARIAVPSAEEGPWDYRLHLLVWRQRDELAPLGDLQPLKVFLRPSFGPGSVRFVEATLGLLREGGLQDDEVLMAWHALHSYLAGFRLTTVEGRREQIESPALRSRAEQLRQLCAASAVPTLSELAESLIELPGDEEFSRGLQLLLQGIRTPI